jgi:hypothetical protein
MRIFNAIVYGFAIAAIFVLVWDVVDQYTTNKLCTKCYDHLSKPCKIQYHEKRH